MSSSGLWLLSSALGLIQATTPTAERLKILAPFFDPKPGEQLTVSERSIALRRGEDQLLIRGELWIKPPKGRCLIIRTDLKKRDKKICRPEPWTWELYDLDAVGSYQLTVIAGESDEGTRLTWPTPYRHANYVPFDAPDLDQHFDVPLKQCTAREVHGERQITLELFDGRRWMIYLPEYDEPVAPKLEPVPNLIVRLDSKKEPSVPGKNKDKEKDPKKADAEDGKTDPKSGEAEPADDAKKSAGTADSEGEGDDKGTGKKRRSVLSQLLSGDYKNVKEETYGFRVPRRNAYQMPSSRFMETSVPQGMKGVCRYMFQGAPGDPRNGVIECYDTDAFRSVYALVSCFSQFSPRLNPHPPLRKSDKGDEGGPG